MRLTRLAAAALCLSLPAPAAAQTRPEMERCRAIEDAARRLACYDAISLSPASPRSKYEPVPLAELESAALSYRGRLVEVVGPLQPGERFFTFAPAGGEGRPIPVDLGALPRREQERLRSECGAGCTATVQGRVAPVNFTTGIVAESVIVH